MGKRVLVLSPHADDAELGCGGYIARTVAEGGSVLVALATVGDIRFMHSEQVVTSRMRIREFMDSMDVLGVKEVEVLTEGLDSKLNTYPQGEMVARLDALHRKFEPDEILIPLPSAHQDHRYCWEVGVALTRPTTAKPPVSMVAAYEYPLSHWGDGSSANAFNGGVYVNVTDYWGTKLKALSQYKSQMRGNNALISESGVEALARLRGLEAGFEYAELLHAMRISRP